MWIHSLRIKHLNSIKCIDIKFDKPITIIYGQNGIGKTTILEAIALLGHLHTMRRVTLYKDNVSSIKESCLSELLGNGDVVTDDNVCAPMDSISQHRFSRLELLLSSHSISDNSLNDI